MGSSVRHSAFRDIAWDKPQLPPRASVLPHLVKNIIKTNCRRDNVTVNHVAVWNEFVHEISLKRLFSSQNCWRSLVKQYINVRQFYQ